MMNKPDFYKNNNQYQRWNTEKTLKKFASLLKWRSDGRDSVLDAGCGPGDVTVELLLPILPSNFERLVGVDISEGMIEYARKTHIHPKVSFQQFNLNVELEKQSLNEIESFDHIVSFFCLMMVQNQSVCLQSFYKLLKPGGNMLLVFLAKHPIWDVYKQQSQDPRWANYMADVEIAPYHNSEDPKKELLDRLIDCGFKDCDVKLFDETYVFDGAEKLKNFVHGISRYIDRIPVDLKQPYLDDAAKRFIEICCAPADLAMDTKTGQIKVPYKLFVAYARK